MMTEELRCAKHPNEETNLRCSRCERPICVRCMVYTSVGVRCRECATERRSGINAPAAGQVLKAAGVALGVVLGLGALWGLFPGYGFWVALLLGFAGGELVSLAADRRRGPELQAVAATMVIGAFALAFILSAGFDGRLIFSTLMAGVALWLAVVRQR
ncbi:MAG: B-box zinc finger protein [Chloroflexota bacterium]|nr:B-box zinc finger protein [Chloroflexota bacterium]